MARTCLAIDGMPGGATYVKGKPGNGAARLSQARLLTSSVTGQQGRLSLFSSETIASVASDGDASIWSRPGSHDEYLEACCAHFQQSWLAADPSLSSTAPPPLMAALADPNSSSAAPPPPVLSR